MIHDDDMLWKLSETTQRYVLKVREKRQETSDSLGDGALLQASSTGQIATSYAYNVGYIEGLKFLETILKVETNNE